MNQMMSAFQAGESRSRGTGDDFHDSEVGLAHRNHGMPAETLRHDITPIGMHYLLTHFDIPYCADPSEWTLSIAGFVNNPLEIDLDALRRREKVTLPVTLECAGNGRALHDDRSRSMPWHNEAVGTSEWTGTPLASLLDEAGLKDEALEVSFIGADKGFDKGCEHYFGRSLTLQQIAETEVLLVYEMNGQPLLPQHGFPLRLIVPGWYGMASVKWLNHIEVLDRPYDGFQQIQTYRFRDTHDDDGRPVSHIRVKSMMVPPGIPDWYTRLRMVDAGPVEIHGRAWSGAGVPIEKVEFSSDGKNWVEAELGSRVGKFAWTGWRHIWNAQPGENAICCRATDANGNIQPMEAPWDISGFGNNMVQRVSVAVR